MKIHSSNAVFHVSDLPASLDFYTTHLGFKEDFVYGEPPMYAGISNGDTQLHLSSRFPYKDNTGHGNLYIFVEEVDELYARLVAAGCEFYSGIGDRDYGVRDFALKDPDGNQIGIGVVLPQTS